jgi:hypothetical protein
MTTEEREGAPILVLALTLLGLLIVTSLLIGTGPLRHRDPWGILPEDTAHWFGWAGGAFLGVSASYSALKRGFPRSIKLWLAVHCVTGIISLIITGVHLINWIGSARPSQFLSFFNFGLMAIIVVGGIGGRYATKIRVVRDYWRILHIPLTALLCTTLTVHILIKTGIL